MSAWTEAYKGYLVSSNAFGDVWIKKDDHIIARPNTVEAAKHAIDELTA